MINSNDTPQWFKSSWSNGEYNCVEVANLSEGAHLVRDTKHHGRGPVLRFAGGEWRAFVLGVKDGEFTR